MKLTERRRWMVLGGLLVATIAAGLAIDDEPAPEKGSRRERRPTSAERAPAAEAASAPVALEFPERLAAALPELPAIDPFRGKSWYVAPPPPPPPKPSAPPLPFKYIGKTVDEGRITVFLAREGRNLIVKAGDTVDGTYAVEEIGNGRVVFVYHPLKEQQILAIGPDK